MKLKDLIPKAKSLVNYKFERKFNELIRRNYRYKNLSPDNRKVVLDLVKKFKPYLRRGRKISDYTIRREMYDLSRPKKMIELNLTREDLKDIREILDLLK